MNSLYYSLVMFFDGYVELFQTYPSLEICTKAAIALGHGAVCIEVGLLQNFGVNQMKKLVGVWYLYDDGSREYESNIDRISVFSIPKWLHRLIRRKEQSSFSDPSSDQPS